MVVIYFYGLKHVVFSFYFDSNRDQGRKGLKSMRDVHAETRKRVACYMCKSNNKWIQVEWQRETVKENNTTIKEAVKAMMEIDKTLAFVENNVRLEGEILELEWEPTWKKVKAELKKGVEKKRMETYEQKELQNDLYRRQKQECHLWLKQRLTPRKTASIMTVIEQMVETRGWKVARGLKMGDVDYAVNLMKPLSTL